MNDRLTILQGDALTVLKTLPDESVQCCITSPPYWGLRDYGVKGQLGLEKTPEEYAGKMVEVFREVRRVLRGDGTCWINCGDSYNSIGHKKSNSGYGTTGLASGIDQEHTPLRRDNTDPKLKHKDLVGIPWRLAFALQADGWWLRQDIIWYKPNPMPESVTDRCTKAHEYIFLLTKSARYFYDAEAIKEHGAERTDLGKMKFGGRINGDSGWHNDGGEKEPNGRNKRSVWTVATDPYTEAHFATFPPDLIKPCILAGTSARGCCPKCGAPWERVVESTKSFESGSGRSGNPINGKQNLTASATNSTPDIRMGPVVSTTTTGWQPTCSHPKILADGIGLPPIPCTVLDPFFGSGTTGMVALELGRKCIGIELNPEYIRLAQDRCNVTPGLALA